MPSAFGSSGKPLLPESIFIQVGLDLLGPSAGIGLLVRCSGVRRKIHEVVVEVACLGSRGGTPSDTSLPYLQNSPQVVGIVHSADTRDACRGTQHVPILHCGEAAFAPAGLALVASAHLQLQWWTQVLVPWAPNHQLA